MGPDRIHLVWWFDLRPDDVKEAQVRLVEPGGNVLDIVDVPGDGMEMLWRLVASVAGIRAQTLLIDNRMRGVLACAASIPSKGESKLRVTIRDRLHFREQLNHAQTLRILRLDRFVLCQRA